MIHSTKRNLRRSAAISAVLAIVISLSAANVAMADVCLKSHPRKGPLYSSQGVYLSFSPGWVDFDGEFDGLNNIEGGNGGRLAVSYGVSRNVSLFLHLEGAAIEDRFNDDWGMGFLDLGIKYSFTPNELRKTRFYILGSLGGAALALEDDFDDNDGPVYVGGTGRVAIGVDYFIGRRAMLFAELGHRGGTFESKIIDDEEYHLINERDFNSTGFHFGVRLGL